VVRATIDPAIVRALGDRLGTRAHERTLPLVDALAQVVPGAALVRGQVVAVRGVADMSLALAMAGQATRNGSWLAAVEHRGTFEFSPEAAGELGVALERMVVVATPPGNAPGAVEVVAALIEGFDVVIVPGHAPLAPTAVRRLRARLRIRGGVVVVVGGHGGWQPDLVLRSTAGGPCGGWEPLEENGRLRRRRVIIEVDARRQGAPARHVFWLPTPDGSIAAVPSDTDRSVVSDGGSIAHVG